MSLPHTYDVPRSRYGVSSWEREGIPNPGTTEAIEQGCKCPRLDNGNGNGLPPGAYGSDPEGGPVFWQVKGCPVHEWLSE